MVRLQERHCLTYLHPSVEARPSALVYHVLVTIGLVLVLLPRGCVRRPTGHRGRLRRGCTKNFNDTELRSSSGILVH